MNNNIKLLNILLYSLPNEAFSFASRSSTHAKSIGNSNGGSVSDSRTFSTNTKSTLLQLLLPLLLLLLLGVDCVRFGIVSVRFGVTSDGSNTPVDATDGKNSVNSGSPVGDTCGAAVAAAAARLRRRRRTPVFV